MDLILQEGLPHPWPSLCQASSGGQLWGFWNPLAVCWDAALSHRPLLSSGWEEEVAYSFSKRD